MILNEKNDLPIINDFNSGLIIVPYYAFIGSHVGSLVAFDQINNVLVQNYSITSQPMNPNTNKPYFQIETNLGFVSFIKLIIF